MRMSRTAFTVYYTDGKIANGDVDWPSRPSLEQIHALVDPLVGGDLEHVTVLDPASDEYRDMFVDELGHQKQKPRNDAATAICRHNRLKHEGGEPDDLPWIAGVAVLFDRIVWR